SPASGPAGDLADVPAHGHAAVAELADRQLCSAGPAGPAPSGPGLRREGRMMSRRYLRCGPAGADVAVALQSARPLVEPDLSGDLLRKRRRVLRRSVRRGKPARWLLSCISVALVVLVLWQWGNAGWILIKAQLAQWL